MVKEIGLDPSTGEEFILKTIDWNEDYTRIERITLTPESYSALYYDFTYYKDSICIMPNRPEGGSGICMFSKCILDTKDEKIVRASYYPYYDNQYHLTQRFSYKYNEDGKYIGMTTISPTGVEVWADSLCWNGDNVFQGNFGGLICYVEVGEKYNPYCNIPNYLYFRFGSYYHSELSLLPFWKNEIIMEKRGSRVFNYYNEYDEDGYVVSRSLVYSNGNNYSSTLYYYETYNGIR